MEPVRYLEFGTEGRVPEGRVGLAENPQPEEVAGLAENPPPEALDAQRHTDHPNGAVGLAGCLLCVADADLAETEKRYAAYLGRSARQDGPARTFDGAGITLAPASALAGLLPGERPPGIPGFAAYTVTVRDLPAAERMLRGNGVPLGRSASGDPFVPSAEALGVAIILRQAD
jgi:hypothetical protein